MTTQTSDENQKDQHESAAYISNEVNHPKRNRDWERKARAKGNVVSYRGIPETLQKKVKKLAEDLEVPMGDVVRALIEHGLKEYDYGFLNLNRKSFANGFVLYIDDG